MSDKLTVIDTGGALANCPFCDSRDVEMVKDVPFGSVFYYVHCKTCFARGLMSSSKTGAYSQWNRVRHKLDECDELASDLEAIKRQLF